MLKSRLPLVRSQHPVSASKTISISAATFRLLSVFQTATRIAGGTKSHHGILSQRLGHLYLLMSLTVSIVLESVDEQLGIL